MSNASLTIRHKLYDFIRVADDKKLNAIYHLLENEIEQTQEWWKDKLFTTELDNSYEAMENGTDKGFTLDELEKSISKLRKKKYGTSPLSALFFPAGHKKKLMNHGIGMKKGNLVWVTAS